MSCPCEKTIRFYLREYLYGRFTLKEFNDWFVPATWDVHFENNPVLEDLVYGIKLRLAEYTSSAFDKNELNRLLKEEFLNG